MQAALRRARRTGAGTVASVSAQLPSSVDPVTTVAASRASGEPWFGFEQPDRGGYAVAAAGSLCALEAHGEQRFDQVVRRWRAIAGSALADSPAAGPAGSGLIAVGGLAFGPCGGQAGHWDGFAPASLVLPEVSIARGGERTMLTVNVLAQPDDTASELYDRARARLIMLRSEPLPLLDPSPVGSYRVHSPMAPAHYEQAVRSALSQIDAGEIEKIVLAREVEVSAPAPYDPAAILGLLRQEFPSCYVFAIGRGDATFIGASPELLVRREGQRVSTVALAGSTGRSADPAVDDHLGERLLRSDKDREENAIVARRIMRALRPWSLWVTATPEPVLVRVANIQHLATPIRAQLISPVPVLQLADVLHPTPAVGGEPSERAQPLIPALEGLDRGWYAGPVGWMDAAGDGELCVALRCALLRDRTARLFAGCGIVRDSDPAAELAETDVKFQALLPVLSS